MTILSILRWAKFGIGAELEIITKQRREEFKIDPDSDLLEELEKQERTLLRNLAYLDKLAMVLSEPDDD